MKREDLKECALCGKGVMHSNNIMFHKISIERYMVNLPAVQRQHGLEMILGGHAGLAQAMGPDEDIAKQVGEADTAILCDPCAFDSTLCLAGLHERITKEEPVDEN